MSATLPAHIRASTAVGELLLPANCTVVTPALVSWGEWEPELAREIEQRVRPGASVAVIGAHVGYFVTLIAQLVGPAGRVVAVEADPDNFALLQENVRRLGLRTVEVNHAAAWSETGRLRIQRSQDGNTGDTRVSPESEGSIDVPAATIDSLLGERSPVDLVLLDVQGSERRAVDGMRGVIGRWRPSVLAEYWPEGARALGEDPRELTRLLRELDYRLDVLEDAPDSDTDAAHGDDELLAAAESEPGGFCTLLATPERLGVGVAAEDIALSLCVPTHDGRAKALGELIDSVVDQITPDLRGRVELVISDGASHDGTAELVGSRLHDGVKIRYKRAESDAGFAAHLLDAVERAGGPWCWLMSSDDALEPGALRRVLESIERAPDAVGLTVSFEPYDSELRAPFAAPFAFVYPDDEARPRAYRDRRALLADLGPMLAYVSAHVVRRDAWLVAAGEAAGMAERPRFFPHIDLISRMLADGSEWRWLPLRLVRDRVGNDSFTSRAFGNVPARYWGTILRELARVYTGLAEGDDEVLRSVMARWRRGVLGNRMLLKYKQQPSHGWRDDVRLARDLMPLYRRDPGFWRTSAPSLLAPHSAAGPILRLLGDTRRGRPRPDKASAPKRAAGGWPARSEHRRAWRRDQVGTVRSWWHSIDLGDDVVTQGRGGDLATMKARLAALRLPELGNRTVLDVAAHEGFFAVAAEQLGAQRVVALHPSSAALSMPDDPEEDPPGVRGFEIVRTARRSRVERVDGDVLTTDQPERFGAFDVVLALDALDRVVSPLDALGNLRRVTAGLAVLECETLAPTANDEMALCEFAACGGREGSDPLLFVPSIPALRSLCLCAGFREVETFLAPSLETRAANRPSSRRVVVHARP
jgi:FkbM family methyltransferase